MSNLMNIAKPHRVSRTFVQRLVAAPAAVFPLLCPVREADWIDGWDPILVLTDSGLAEPDCVFVTANDSDQAVWYITRHEPDNGFLEMIKTTPDVTACRITIQLRPSDSGSDAIVTYSHASLGPRGDAFIESFTDGYYRTFMQTWEARINHYLLHGTMLAAGHS